MKLSFQAKVLLPVLGLLVLVSAFTLVAVNRQIGGQMQAEARTTLATADAGFRNALELRSRNLASRYRTLVNEPRFRAVSRLGDGPTMTNLLRELLEEVGEDVELFGFAHDPGEFLAEARRDPRFELAPFLTEAGALIDPAFEGDTAVGTLAAGGRLLTVVAVPVVSHDRLSLEGVLVIAHRLRSAVLQELKSVTHTEIALGVEGRVMGATLPLPQPADREALEHVLTAALPREHSPVSALATVDERFYAWSGLYSEQGRPVFRYVLLSSVEGRLQALRRTQVALVGIGLGGLLGCGVVVWWLVRHVTQPLRDLRDGAEAVGRGDFSRRIEARSEDECGALATTFNRMTGNLEESRARLEDTVSALRKTQGELIEREQRLRESEEDLRLIIASARDYAIFTVGTDGGILRWNPAAESLLGYAGVQAEGLAYAELFCPEDRSAGLPATLLKQAAAEGRAAYEGWRQRRDGTRFWADIALAPLPGREGHVRGFVEITRDVTVRKQAEETLRAARDAAEAANRAKTEFLANMSHELRTPMNAIIGMSSLLLEDPLSPEHRECVRTIRGSGDALLGLIDSILDLASIEAGRIELKAQPFVLAESMEHAVAPLLDDCARRGLGFDLRIAPGLPAVWIGDGARVRQVVGHLVDNAVKFTERGRIDVSVTAGPMVSGRAELRIAVEDTGIGIPPDALERLFQVFSPVDGSTKRRHGGTGLGLAICQRLVGLMGGRIDVTSTPGVGSRFVATLMLGVEAEKELPLDRSFAELHPLKVLLVEDNPVNSRVACMLLKRLGFTPLVAENGREALERLLTEAVDLILMDLRMPVMDGLEATVALRRVVPGDRPPYIMALTANSLPEDQAACAQAGMHDFMGKPVQLEKLAAGLARGHAWLEASGHRALPITSLTRTSG